MMTRITLVVCFFAIILAVPGCLDENDKATANRVRQYLDTRAADDPAAAAARDELDAMITRSDSEAATITALLGMLGLGGAGGALKLILRYRSIAVDIVQTISAAKKPADGDAKVYVIDKAEVRNTMQPSTLHFVEAVRAQIETPVTVQVTHPTK
jgi:hypothetical protein